MSELLASRLLATSKYEGAIVARIQFPSGATFIWACAVTMLISGPVRGQIVEPWVVVGFVPHPAFDSTDNTYFIAANRIERRLLPCGLRAFWDYSGKFSGFDPNGTLIVVDGYISHEHEERDTDEYDESDTYELIPMTLDEAEVLLAITRQCIPDAYIQMSTYAGE